MGGYEEMMTFDDKVGGWVKKGQNHEDVILEWSLIEIMQLRFLRKICLVQVNICQKHLFLPQVTFLLKSVSSISIWQYAQALILIDFSRSCLIFVGLKSNIKLAFHYSNMYRVSRGKHLCFNLL